MKYKCLLMVVVFGLVFGANQVFAGSATISWVANGESDLAGYKVYYGTSARTGTNPKVCGMCGYANTQTVTGATSYTLNNLTDGSTYYFSVSAYDSAGNESSFSSEVSKSFAAVVGAPSDPGGGNGGGSGSSSGGSSTSGNSVTPVTVPAIGCASGTGGASINRNLYKSIKGDDVKILQNFLISKGYLAATSEGLSNASGFFGSLTEKAVQAFQTAQGIVSSGSFWSTGFGMIGPTTRNKINSMLGSSCSSNSVSATPVTSTTVKGCISRNLFKSLKGDDVKVLQSFLIKQGLLPSDSVTGFFGAGTETAVEKFQTAQGIVSSGNFWSTGYGMTGPTTRAKINAMLGSSCSSTN